MLYIVIVNWNLEHDTIECIESLIHAGVSLNQIILIDNGSGDDSTKSFKSLFNDELHLIINDDNLGYVKAINQGIQVALNHKAEWILLLNNDTVVDGKFYQEIQNYITDSDPFAIITPLIFYYSQPERIWNLGDHLIGGTLLTYNSYQGKTAPVGLPKTIPVDFVSGCAMIINSDVIERIGMFDETLVMYGEEVDYCWRARIAGYHAVCITRSKVWHKVSKSADKNKPRSRYYKIRNQIIFYRRYSHGMQRVFLFVFSILRSMTIIVRDILQQKTELIPPLVKGWVDGWKQ
jgi:hypothetical protein